MGFAQPQFSIRHRKKGEPDAALATLNSWRLSVQWRVRDVMMSIIPTELLWLAFGFIMLMAAFMAGAAE
jgi:hypothetical protein